MRATIKPLTGTGLPPFPALVLLKTGAERTTTSVTAVATTTACAWSTYLHRLIAAHARGVRILAIGCPQLDRRSSKNEVTIHVTSTGASAPPSS